MVGKGAGSTVSFSRHRLHVEFRIMTMKKLLVTISVALLAATSFGGTADARPGKGHAYGYYKNHKAEPSRRRPGPPIGATTGHTTEPMRLRGGAITRKNITTTGTDPDRKSAFGRSSFTLSAPQIPNRDDGPQGAVFRLLPDVELHASARQQLGGVRGAGSR